MVLANSAAGGWEPPSGTAPQKAPSPRQRARRTVTFRRAPPAPPPQAGGQMEPRFHPARLCAELRVCRRCDTSRQQQAGGEQRRAKSTTERGAIFVSEKHSRTPRAALAPESRRAGSLGSRRRTKKHDLGIFPRPLFFFFFLFFQGHSVTFPGLSFLLCRMETTCTDHTKRNGDARRGLSENRGASGLCHQEGFRGDNLVRRSAALRGTIT